MTKDEIEITMTLSYTGPIDANAEDDINQMAARWGYKFVGSGLNGKTNLRDMKFTKSLGEPK